MATEFAELGYLPAVWEANDIPTIRTHAVYHNVEQEVLCVRTLDEFGPAVEDLRRYRTAGHRVLTPVETARLPGADREAGGEILVVTKLRLPPPSRGQDLSNCQRP